LNVAATWATPDEMFLRSFLRGRAVVAGFAMDRMSCRVCADPRAGRR
jgi:hypothetical protein